MPENPASRRAVVVFARAPSEERRVKPVGAAARVEDVHRALLEHTLRAAASVEGSDVLLVTTGDLSETRAMVRSVGGAPLKILPQRGDTFEERLEHAVGDSFARGYGQVLVIGSDTPELDGASLEKAFARLDGGDESRLRAVIGRSTDGGYYLLGLSRFCREAFRGIEFHGLHVATQTLEALGRVGFSVAHLGALADIDDVEGLAAAIARLRRSVDRETLELAAILARALEDLGDAAPASAPAITAAPVILVARGPPRRRE